MAYPLTPAQKAKFLTPYPQHCNIVLEQAGNDPIILSDDVIVQGSFGIDRYSVSGEALEMGSMIAAQLEFVLQNPNGEFNDITFEGASLHVSISADDVILPMGYFTIDAAPRKLKTIAVVALDRMVQFDKPAKEESFTFPCSVKDMIIACCSVCNVPIATHDWTKIVNSGLEVTEYPSGEQDVTYRSILQWCGEIVGAVGFIDWNGEFRLTYYDGESESTLTPSNRTESDMADNDIVITGVSISDTVYGTDGYTLSIEDNPLIAEGAVDTVGTSLATIYEGFTYRPFAATCLPMPWLYPCDKVTFTDANGNEFVSYLTNIQFALNSLLSIESRGKSATVASYATANPLTKREAAVIKQVQTQITEQLTDRIQAVEHLSEIAANSLGYFQTNVQQPDGSVITYMHNKENLTESTIVYKIAADGFFVSTDGGNTYVRGFDSDGNAVVNLLSAIGIQSEWIDINGVVDRINSEDGTRSINGSKVAVDGMGLDVVMTSVTETAKTQQESITSLQGTAEGLRLDVTKNQNDIAGVEGDVSTINANLNEYFVFDTAGLRIGRAGSPFSTLYAEDGMIIQSGGVDTAYFRNAEMQITRANVLESIQIGKFKFIPRTNGNLSFRYVGGGN